MEESTEYDKLEEDTELDIKKLAPIVKAGLERIGAKDFIILLLMLILAIMWHFYQKDLNNCDIYYQNIINNLTVIRPQYLPI